LAGLGGLLGGGSAIGALAVLLGALAWGVGQAHHALRHGGVRSPLARGVLDAIAGATHRQDPG
jgi:hypothetical protein